MTLQEAASLLRLPPESVSGLVNAGYVRAAQSVDSEPRFALGDIKAFLARNGDGDPSVDVVEATYGDLDLQRLLDALAARSEDMARRAHDLLVVAFPEASGWPDERRARFLAEAQARFEALVAVAAIGEGVDVDLIEELRCIGAEAAAMKTPLHELLMVLRISRDLLVQTSVEVAEELGRHWALALSLLLTRVLPGIDRLTDAIAAGYWQTAPGNR
jgi:hypothetical protein